jgi:tRNA A22 N-methylase
VPLPVSDRVAALVAALPVDPDSPATYADIGHDLGHIPLAALTRYPLLRAIAVEIQPEAEARTRAQLSTWSIPAAVAARLTLRTGDGLAPVSPGEVDGALFAGLGERTLLAALAAAPAVTASLGWIVCCPPTLSSELRPGLAALGFTADLVAIAPDRGRLYEILCARPYGKHTPYDPDPVTRCWGHALFDASRVPRPLARAFVDDAARRFAPALRAHLRAYGPGSGKEALGERLATLAEARARLT